MNKLSMNSNMLSMACSIVVASTVTGCESDPQVIHDVKTVEIPVRVSCVNKIPESPKLHTDDEIKAMPSYQAVLVLLEDRIASRIYQEQAEAVIDGCR